MVEFSVFRLFTIPFFEFVGFEHTRIEMTTKNRADFIKKKKRDTHLKQKIVGRNFSQSF